LVDYLVTDVVSLPIADNSTDFVVNFLGFEDINMTHGLSGVASSIGEIHRILRKNGFVELALCIEGDEPDEILSRDVSRYIGHGAFFGDKDYYLTILEDAGFGVVGERWFYSHRKMTARQAEEELRFACEETPKNFSEFGVRTKTFDEVWNRFGSRIQRVGLSYYSDICVLIAEKVAR
jgi:ubiquinone/menaquinone biosynthesis C-methylase UbiE